MREKNRFCVIRVSDSEWAFPVICFAHFNKDNEKSDNIVETLFSVKRFTKKNHWKPCSDGEIPNYSFSKLEVLSYAIVLFYTASYKFSCLSYFLHLTNLSLHLHTTGQQSKLSWEQKGLFVSFHPYLHQNITVRWWLKSSIQICK